MDRQAVKSAAAAALLGAVLLLVGCGAQWTDLYLPGIVLDERIYSTSDCDRSQGLSHREAQSFFIRPKFTAQVRRIYREEFTQADVDGGGELSMREFKTFLSENSLLIAGWNNQCPIQPQPSTPPRNPIQ